MNKTIARSIFVVFFGLLCFLFLFTQAAVAQEKPVTSDKLSLEDAVAHMKKDDGGQQAFGGITPIGIRNKDGEATCYFLIFRGSGQTLPEKSLFVRLDSGQWIGAGWKIVTK